MSRLSFRACCHFATRLLLVISLALSVFHSAQAQEDEVVRVDTDLVVLNITVLDKNGQYVPGLKLADFKVFEEGREVPIKLISSFGAHESPFASVILLDTSGSMESRMSLGRSAAIRFLDGLRPEDVAAVYNFDYRVEQVQDFSSARDLAPMAFGLRAKGMTALYDAIIRAAESLSSRQEPRKAIVILSDGMDTKSKASSGKALDAAMAIGAGIYAVDMSASEVGSTNNQQTAALLKNFADKTGGRFIATPGGPALRDAFASIAQELGHQYTIAFRPPNQTRDGRWRSLDVKLSRPELTVRTRKGYRAPKR
ncbi:MAG TPA: VWA domain-containing protein [Pyrinomonadaceae bacterium]|nr:VWA domain-containing protein [Pyrinomonadaceae bacterium]